MADTSYFLKIGSGNDLPGQSKDPKHVDWWDLDSFQYGVARSIGSGGEVKAKNAAPDKLPELSCVARVRGNEDIDLAQAVLRPRLFDLAILHSPGAWFEYRDILISHVESDTGGSNERFVLFSLDYKSMQAHMGSPPLVIVPGPAAIKTAVEAASVWARQLLRQLSAGQTKKKSFR